VRVTGSAHDLAKPPQQRRGRLGHRMKPFLVLMPADRLRLASGTKIAALEPDPIKRDGLAAIARELTRQSPSPISATHRVIPKPS